jgi:hypothetical protein
MDKPPQNGQDIIICVNGIYYLAVYDAGSDTYKLSYEPGTVFDPRESLIYWIPNFRGWVLQ